MTSILASVLSDLRQALCLCTLGSQVGPFQTFLLLTAGHACEQGAVEWMATRRTRVALDVCREAGRSGRDPEGGNKEISQEDPAGGQHGAGGR